MTSSSRSFAHCPRTLDDIFTDYMGRRAGLIHALTDDVERFFELCDPEKENLCLFGNPNGSWKVSIPEETVPTVLPEPCLGINFARDGMDPSQWISRVALHSTSWLIAVAYFHAGIAGLNRDDRGRLFDLITDLPDVYEAVRDWRKPAKDNSSEASRSKSTITVKRASDGGSKSAERLCGCCGDCCSGDEFWIVCGFCQTSYHGKCVEVTPTMAETINKYECPVCYVKRINILSGN